MIKKLPTSQEEVQNTARDILNSIAERDIYTGDGVEMITVDSTGVKIQNFPLRRDWCFRVLESLILLGINLQN